PAGRGGINGRVGCEVTRRRPETDGSTAGTTTATASAGSTEDPAGAGPGERRVREHAHKDSGSHLHCQLGARIVGPGSPHQVHLTGERFAHPIPGTHAAHDRVPSAVAVL